MPYVNNHAHLDANQLTWGTGDTDAAAILSHVVVNNSASVASTMTIFADGNSSVGATVVAAIDVQNIADGTSIDFGQIRIRNGIYAEISADGGVDVTIAYR